MSVPTYAYVLLSAVLFLIGTLGVLLRRNLLVILMCIELMLNAANLALIAFGAAWKSLDGQVMALLVMAVAAAKVAVALALIVTIFRYQGTVDVDEVSLLRGGVRTTGPAIVRRLVRPLLGWESGYVRQHALSVVMGVVVVTAVALAMMRAV
jgi:NADH-quinone oxidoreductase subunit K